MKNFVVAALITAASGLAFTSCNNGAYEADPNAPSALNPLNPNSGVTVHLGTMRVDVNNTTTAFYPAFYKEFDGDIMMLVGSRAKDVTYKHKFVTMIVGYNTNPNHEFSPISYYLTVDPTGDSSLVYVYFPSIDYIGQQFSVNGKEDGNLRGYIAGNYYRAGIAPGNPDIIVRNLEDGIPPDIQDYNGPEEVIELRKGEYYVPKK